MSVKFDKNNLLFYFSTANFPENIPPEVLSDQEFILNEISAEPELIGSKTKKSKYHTFYVQETAEQRKAQKVEQNKNRALAKQNFNDGGFSKKGNQEDEGTFDFFDNFKGKSNNSQVKEFISQKKAVDFRISKETDLFIDTVEHKSQFYDFVASKQKPSVGKFDADKLFENAELFNSGHENSSSAQNSSSAKSSVSNIKPREQLTPQENEDLKRVNIKLLGKINERLSYPEDKPLWYIYHTQAKSGFGPISSKDLEQMYLNGLVDGKTEVRFIDLINVKHKRPFAFFKLKEIENNIVSDIEASSLIFYSNLIPDKEKGDIIMSNYIASEKVEKRPQDENSIYNIGKPSGNAGFSSGMVFHTGAPEFYPKKTMSQGSQGSQENGNVKNQGNQGFQRNQGNQGNQGNLADQGNQGNNFSLNKSKSHQGQGHKQHHKQSNQGGNQDYYQEGNQDYYQGGIQGNYQGGNQGGNYQAGNQGGNYQAGNQGNKSYQTNNQGGYQDYQGNIQGGGYQNNYNNYQQQDYSQGKSQPGKKQSKKNHNFNNDSSNYYNQANQQYYDYYEGEGDYNEQAYYQEKPNTSRGGKNSKRY